ncbi:LysR family transcriptional regulator [Bordetella petrii]|uniref:LysR family transcriptional regulator n=1 Tax=Bordetella petrii TaxID=94624 RepID=UPI0037338F16
MRDLDFTSLRLFAIVCETRNIARASERANIAGSAISKRLAQLEHTVGAKLLVRRRHGVEPSAAGETLLEHARSIMDSAARIERDMLSYTKGVTGLVRILASSSAMAESLPDDVARFLKAPAHADIRVDLEEGLSHQVIRGVREGMASIGICWDAADFKGLQARPYREDRLAIAVPARHPLAARKRVSFAQTLDYEHAGMPTASAVQVLLHRAAARAGKPLIHRVIVANFDSALRVVQAGLAITIVPVEVARPYTRGAGLRIIPLEDAWARRRFMLCFRDADSLTPAARLLLEHLAGAAAAPAPAGL